MNSKVYGFLGLLTALVIGGCSYLPSRNIDLESFRNLVNNAKCADISNQMYLIDDQMVFWDRQGNCPDNMYGFTLFGENPEEVFCSRTDSIAGPREYCTDESYRGIFQTIINNLEQDDLGLGSTYQVEQILLQRK